MQHVGRPVYVEEFQAEEKQAQVSSDERYGE